MNFEFGGANLGYRYYREEDVGTAEETGVVVHRGDSGGFLRGQQLGLVYQSDAFGGFRGFVGTMYLDDISARVRQDSPEREYLLLNGFNSESDLENVTLNPDYAIGIAGGGEVAPREGSGYLAFHLSDTGANRMQLGSHPRTGIHELRPPAFRYVRGWLRQRRLGEFRIVRGCLLAGRRRRSPDIQHHLVAGIVLCCRHRTLVFVRSAIRACSRYGWFSAAKFQAECGGPRLCHGRSHLATPLEFERRRREEIPMYIDNLRLRVGWVRRRRRELY